MTRTVFAIDVTTSVVSIGCVQETDGPVTPMTSWVDAANDGGSHRPRTTWELASKTADEVVAKVTASGPPTLVVMAKQLWGGINGAKPRGAARASVPADPSAARRIQLHSLIEDRLHRAGVPVAEYPYATALRWARGSGEKGGSTATMTALTTFAADSWGIITRTVVDPLGKRHPAPFRPAVAVLAAIGGMAVGVAVEGIEVTDTRLEALDAGTNRSVQWPAGFTVPSSPASWDERRRHPEVLTVGV